MASVRCRIEIEYSSEDQARHVHRSVELDNQGYIRSEVKGNSILVEAETASLNSMIHTLDDFLSCVSVAEGIVRKGA